MGPVDCTTIGVVAEVVEETSTLSFFSGRCPVCTEESALMTRILCTAAA